MKWLLLLVVAIDGEISVEIVNDYDTMAECHVGGTQYFFFEERKQTDQELLCFPTTQEVMK